MSKTRNPDALIRIEDAIKVLCWETCCPGVCCPDGYCAKMWDAFEDVERVDAVPVRPSFLERGKDGYMRCHNCGSRASAIKARYCHHCGAKLDGKAGDHEKAD